MWWGGKSRKAREQELDREIRAHLDLEAAEQREAGLRPDEAQYAARRAFGNTAIVREDARSVWGSRCFDSLGQDIACALRLFRRAPALLPSSLPLWRSASAPTLPFSPFSTRFCFVLCLTAIPPAWSPSGTARFTRTASASCSISTAITRTGKEAAATSKTSPPPAGDRALRRAGF